MLRDQAIDVYITCLSDSMTSILALLIHGWIPVEIIKDDRVGPSEVDAQASGSTREDESQDTRVIIKAIGEDLTLLDFSGSIQTKILMSMNIEELL